MTTDIVQYTSVVKHAFAECVDARRQPFQSEDVDLAARIQWVLDHRKDLVANADQWGLKASLSRQNVTSLRRRNKGMHAETAKKLARVANVDPGWLGTGDGPHPEERAVSEETIQIRDHFPQRAIAVRHTRMRGASETALTAVCTSPRYNKTELFFKNAAWWSSEIEKLTKQEHEDAGLALRADPSGFQQQIRDNRKEMSATAREDARNRPKKKEPDPIPVHATVTSPQKQKKRAS